MNEHVTRPRREPTQAAEGLPRWRWTLEEFERFIELGILTEDDRVELIGGEIVPMAAKGARHERVRTALHNWISRRLPMGLWVGVELGWRPDGETYSEPDILVAPECDEIELVVAGNVKLLIEVADSSLKFDTSGKAPLYARLGVQEYWVINALTLETRTFREPSLAGYRQSERFGPDRLLTPVLVPAVAVKLIDLRVK